MRESWTSGAELSAHASEASLGDLGTVQTRSRPGADTDTFEFEEEQNGEGKEEGPGAERNLPGWLPRGLQELFPNRFS